MSELLKRLARPSPGDGQRLERNLSSMTRLSAMRPDEVIAVSRLEGCRTTVLSSETALPHRLMASHRRRGPVRPNAVCRGRSDLSERFGSVHQPMIFHKNAGMTSPPLWRQSPLITSLKHDVAQFFHVRVSWQVTAEAPAC